MAMCARNFLLLLFSLLFFFYCFLNSHSVSIFIANFWLYKKLTHTTKTSCLLWFHKWLQSQIMLLRHCMRGLLSDHHISFTNHFGLEWISVDRIRCEWNQNYKSLYGFSRHCFCCLCIFFVWSIFKWNAKKSLCINKPIYLVMLV